MSIPDKKYNTRRNDIFDIDHPSYKTHPHIHHADPAAFKMQFKMTDRLSFLFLGYLINSSVHRWHGRKATSASLLGWFDLHLIHGFIRVAFMRNIGTTTVGTTTAAKGCFAFPVKEGNNIFKRNMQLLSPCTVKEKNKIRRQN